jgi:hypothetical protein
MMVMVAVVLMIVVLMIGMGHSLDWGESWRKQTNATPVYLVIQRLPRPIFTGISLFAIALAECVSGSTARLSRNDPPGSTVQMIMTTTSARSQQCRNSADFLEAYQKYGLMTQLTGNCARNEQAPPDQRAKRDLSGIDSSRHSASVAATLLPQDDEAQADQA